MAIKLWFGLLTGFVTFHSALSSEVTPVTLYIYSGHQGEFASAASILMRQTSEISTAHGIPTTPLELNISRLEEVPERIGQLPSNVKIQAVIFLGHGNGRSFILNKTRAYSPEEVASLFFDNRLRGMFRGNEARVYFYSCACGEPLKPREPSFQAKFMETALNFNELFRFYSSVMSIAHPYIISTLGLRMGKSINRLSVMFAKSGLLEFERYMAIHKPNSIYTKLNTHDVYIAGGLMVAAFALELILMGYTRAILPGVSAVLAYGVLAKTIVTTRISSVMTDGTKSKRLFVDESLKSLYDSKAQAPLTCLAFLGGT